MAQQQNGQADERLSAARRGYGHQWRKLRRLVLCRRPLCADPFHIHESNSAVVLATDVHHIVPLASARPIRELNSEENLMPLCHSCHSRITSSTGGRHDSRGEGEANLYERPQLDRRPSQLHTAAGFDRGVE